MGEARRRARMVVGPGGIPQTQQVQMDMKHARPRVCECGCEYFEPVFKISVIPALVSPTARDFVVQKAVMICHKCKKVLDLKAETKDGDGAKEENHV